MCGWRGRARESEREKDRYTYLVRALGEIARLAKPGQNIYIYRANQNQNVKYIPVTCTRQIQEISMRSRTELFAVRCAEHVLCVCVCATATSAHEDQHSSPCPPHVGIIRFAAIVIMRLRARIRRASIVYCAWARRAPGSRECGREWHNA